MMLQLVLSSLLKKNNYSEIIRGDRVDTRLGELAWQCKLSSNEEKV